MSKKLFRLSTTQIILLGFLAVIFVGSLLLYLPISSASGKSVTYLDALFTSTTATCVTGLVTVPTYTTWSLFGQIVILILIQIGGLGVITVISGFMIILKRKLGLSDRILIQDAFNLNTLSGLVKFVKKVIKGTLIVEACGALLYMTVFIPDFGARGIWISVFNSISAFCNAGIDIFAPDSLCSYATNPVITFTTSALIILGGIGYIVWWDVLNSLKHFKSHKLKCFKALTLHSKISIISTLILLISGTVFFLIFEHDNPQTIKDNSLFDKIQICFFQSVTTRTAGFMSVPQRSLTSASTLISLMLMFIGGSPVGTAGGIKTVTVFVLICSAYSNIKNKSEITIFGRNVADSYVRKAVAVVCMSFFITLISTLLLSCLTNASMMDITYETVSATATVGLSRDLTSTLDSWGKILITATMYFGRVSPISLAFAFKTRKESQNIIKNPAEDISVG